MLLTRVCCSSQKSGRTLDLFARRVWSPTICAGRLLRPACKQVLTSRGVKGRIKPMIFLYLLLFSWVIELRNQFFADEVAK